MSGRMAEDIEFDSHSIVVDLVEIFDQREVKFTGPNAWPAAQQVHSSQRGLHERIFGRLTELMNERGGSGSAVRWSDLWGGLIAKGISEGFDLRKIENGEAIVASQSSFVATLETEASINSIFKRAAALKMLDIEDVVTAAYMRGIRRLIDYDVIRAAGTSSARLVSAIARVESSLLIDSARKMQSAIFLNQSSGSVSTIQSRFVETSNALEGNLAKLAEKVDAGVEAVSVAIAKIAAVESSVDRANLKVEAFEVDIDSRFLNADEKANAFIESVKTEVNFGDLKIHWVDRANCSRVAFMASGVVLGLLLVLLPSFGIYEKDAIIGFMKGLVEAATVEVGADPGPVTVAVATISRLVIITIPLALYFWLIRLVVRFNMRSMLLMDDARQRATMLETYYRMIEKDAANKEDRALVLQALLRPAPGHGSDTVEPPNFAEVIDKAMGRTT